MALARRRKASSSDLAAESACSSSSGFATDADIVISVLAAATKAPATALRKA